MPTPAVVEELGAALGARPLTCEPGIYERRRAREGERRLLARVPDWFSADEVVPDRMTVVHGEPV